MICITRSPPTVTCPVHEVPSSGKSQFGQFLPFTGDCFQAG